MRYVLRMRFANPSNNEAEYEAILHGMRMAKACGAHTSRSTVIRTSSPNKS
jgi:ribonuclease HI